MLAFKRSKEAETKKQRSVSNKKNLSLVVDSKTCSTSDPSIIVIDGKHCNTLVSEVMEEAKLVEQISSEFLRDDDSNVALPSSVFKGDFLTTGTEEILKLSHDAMQLDNDSFFIPVMDTQLSSVHVAASIPLGLDDPFPLTVMSTDLSNNNALAEDPILYQFVEDGYEYGNETSEDGKEQQKFCQCCRCANKETPHLANDRCPICQDSPMFDKCVKEFGFICKNCPPSVACRCNLCQSEPVKLQKLKNGYCSRCKDTAISSLCALRKGICPKCSMIEVSGGSVEMVVDNFNAHYVGVKNKGGQTKLTFVSSVIKEPQSSVKKGLPKSKKIPKKEQVTSRKPNISKATTTKRGKKSVPEATSSKNILSEDSVSNSEDVEESETEDIPVAGDEQRKREAMTAEMVSLEAMKNRAERKEKKAGLRKKSDKKSEIWTYFSEVTKV